MIEFGAVLEDLRHKRPLEYLPTFHCYILRDRYVGEPFALAMHAEIFRRIAKKEPPYRYYDTDRARELFASFLAEHGYTEPGKKAITVAGKNFYHFDYRFLENDGWHKSLSYNFHRRCCDPAQLYFDPSTDDELPDLNRCLVRACIKKEVSHTAVEDALDVVRLLRNHYSPKEKE